ncbi:flavin reductase [Acinetobacter lactucae]|uniref:Flavin reductase n=1 Tax=Acinetobacter lactucae TaxID=1785128 RepID=A0A3R9QFQ5_9GAMM|nr:flavin reductase family protein [Acinetobacter lactucae]RSO58826.1 flavin reductase [Acinetobacter lactucae]
MSIVTVPLEKSFRLLNHGPTVLVSAQHQGTQNVMAASWACPVDFYPAKFSIVLDKQTFTRDLVTQSGYFILQVPVARQAEMIVNLGSESFHDHPDKLERNHVQFISLDDQHFPYVKGCIAWILCKLLPNEYTQNEHDLFVGVAEQAWADDRVFKDGHWNFEEIPQELRSVHYIAGGQFYITGESLKINHGP